MKKSKYLSWPRRLSSLQIFKLYEEFMNSPKSLIVKDKTLIDRSPQGAINDYIFYLKRHNRGII